MLRQLTQEDLWELNNVINPIKEKNQQSWQDLSDPEQTTLKGQIDLIIQKHKIDLTWQEIANLLYDDKASTDIPSTDTLNAMLKMHIYFNLQSLLPEFSAVPEYYSRVIYITQNQDKEIYIGWGINYIDMPIWWKKYNGVKDMDSTIARLLIEYFSLHQYAKDNLEILITESLNYQKDQDLTKLFSFVTEYIRKIKSQKVRWFRGDPQALLNFIYTHKLKNGITEEQLIPKILIGEIQIIESWLYNKYYHIILIKDRKQITLIQILEYSTFVYIQTKDYSSSNNQQKSIMDYTIEELRQYLNMPCDQWLFSYNDLNKLIENTYQPPKVKAIPLVIPQQQQLQQLQQLKKTIISLNNIKVMRIKLILGINFVIYVTTLIMLLIRIFK